MRSPTRHNHYVPIWYQKGFIVRPGTKLFCLELTVRDGGRFGSVATTGNSVSARAPKSCFWAEDLYTTRFGSTINDDVEKYLFGEIDNDGAQVVRAFANSDLRTMHRLFQRFFDYLDVQKLRTPKGLDWIRSNYTSLTQLDLMLEMQHLRSMHCTMWFECVREIVSAKQSDVKFIVTDHPVTVYNAAYAPSSSVCQYPGDPAIALKGTQTIFALDADHCLILTNLEYAKDPHGSDLRAPRTNARYGGQTIAHTDRLVRSRNLTREEVASINYLLKARAHNYIAAGKEDWLYPEREVSVGNWEALRTILLPPSDQLWQFGGEIYVGYKDGSAGYQDEFGRTSRLHENLQKKKRAAMPGPNDPCGCESGRKYKKCCDGIALDERSPWDVYSIRERNILFANAVIHILGLDSGKSWDDVRREISDDQVKEIYSILEALWPSETNIADLLPRPDKRVLRATYLGLMDPRTVAGSVTSYLAFFDEIVVVNPFQNPGYINKEYSPIYSPGQHKSQTLKNVYLLFALMPFIQSGVVHMVPDPMEINADVRRTVMATATEKVEASRPGQGDMSLALALAKDDHERAILRLPEDSLRRHIQKSNPEIGPELLERTVRYMKDKLNNDPYALLQPLTVGDGGGELQMFRGVSIEVALFFARLTGSVIYTDLEAYWKQLHILASAAKNIDGVSDWKPLADAAGAVVLTTEINPVIIGEMRASGGLGYIRRFYRRVRDAVRDNSGNVEPMARELAGRLYKAAWITTKAWCGCETTVTPSKQIQVRVEMSIPKGGFQSNTVDRLVVTAGRPVRANDVPLAFFIKPLKRNDSEAVV